MLVRRDAGAGSGRNDRIAAATGREGRTLMSVWSGAFAGRMLLLVGALGVFAGPAVAQPLPEQVARTGFADSILVNGKIVSMDDATTSSEPGRTYEALAVKGNTIMKVGTNAEVRALAGSFTKVYDLKGRTVIPGIIETHQHIYGRALRWLDRFGIRSPAKEIRPQAAPTLEETQKVLREAVSEAVKDMKPGEWLMVQMRPHPSAPADLDLWGDTRRLTNRKTLDLFSPNHPVMVSPGNRNFLNSAALKELNEFLPGYNESIRESMHADEIGADPADIGWAGSQEVSVIEWEMFLKNLDPNVLAEMLRLESEAWASLGVTAFSSRIQFPKIMTGYAKLAELGKMPIRFNAHYEVHRMPTDPKETRQLYRRTGVLQGIGDDYFWFDGVASERWDSHHPEACTGPDTKAPAHLKERETCPKPGDLHWDTLSNAIRSGWRIKGVHTCGSESLRQFTQMIDMAIKDTSTTLEDVRNEHYALEHCDLIGKLPDVVDKLKKYGLIISCGPHYMSTFPQFIKDYGPYNDPQHLKNFFLPFKTWIDSGVLLVGQHYGGGAFVGGGGEGSVGRGRQPPFYQLWVTLSRMVNGWIWVPEERIDRVRALKMWTRWAAKYMMREDKMGSLEEGKWADLVILDRDYFTIPENDILKIRPLMTMVGGNVVVLNKKLAQEWNTVPVGEQFDFEDQEVEWILKELQTAKVWNGEPF
jgi:predicted amidohydrolase YtcJ